MTRRSLLSLSVLPLAGCYKAEVGPDQIEKKSIPMDASELLSAELKIGAGELIVKAGTPQLADLEFEYNVAAWKPVVRYNSMGFRGYLTVEQPKAFKAGENMKNKWTLRFNEKKPLDLRVNLGAGEARIELGQANLRGLEINVGVGKLDLDLRGNPERGYLARINGGVGDAVIRLPRDVGVSAHAGGGIGNIETQGLTKRGDGYENDAVKTSKVRIRLEVKGGVGSIHLIAD